MIVMVSLIWRDGFPAGSFDLEANLRIKVKRSSIFYKNIQFNAGDDRVSSCPLNVILKKETSHALISPHLRYGHSQCS